VYSSLQDMLKKKRVSLRGEKTNPVQLTTHEGIVEFYNSLNRNERIKYRYYTSNDAYYLDYRSLDASYFKTYDETVAYIETLQALGPTITVVYQEQIAACWGFARVVPGVYEAWCLGSKLFNKHPIATTRTAKFVLEHGAKYIAAHRIQLTVRADNKVANNWASVLQFQYEGLMKQFGHDKADYVMFAKYY
jgi:RimJ/RimL family protein N-acetyltransferase